MDLLAVLPVLLPRAIAWAEGESARVQESGVPLVPEHVEWARKLGVLKPELVRIEFAPALPMPADSELREAAIAAGLLGPQMCGLTLGYSIFLRQPDGSTTHTLAHELRHVYQYEQAGSIAKFLPDYLLGALTGGYANSPHEVDAREASALLFHNG